jgi:tetratricopeptide (TPR) repeat protein
MKTSTKSIIKPKILLIVIFSLWQISVFSQTAEETYALAQKALAIKDTNLAENLLLRSIYFLKDNELKSEALFLLSKMKFAGGDKNSALKYSSLSYNIANDSLKNEIIFYRTYIFLLEKDFLSAEEEILEVNPGNSDYFNKRYHLYCGTVYFAKRDYDAAYNEFKNIIRDTILLKKELKKASKISKRSSYWYFFASAILPGSGQIMTGHLKQGLNSLFLLSGLAAIFFVITREYTWLEGFAAVFPWYERYFMGGVNDAYDYAEILKQQKLLSIYDNITSKIKH